jgi:hypothetical protein
LRLLERLLLDPRLLLLDPRLPPPRLLLLGIFVLL